MLNFAKSGRPGEGGTHQAELYSGGLPTCFESSSVRPSFNIRSLPVNISAVSNAIWGSQSQTLPGPGTLAEGVSAAVSALRNELATQDFSLFDAGSLPQIQPGPGPSSSTITLAEGVSAAVSALRNELATQDFSLFDAGSLPQIQPGPGPSTSTITLAEGVSVPASATQDSILCSPLSDTSYTAHIDIIPLSPSNHEPLEHVDENTIWRWMHIPPPPRPLSPLQPSSPETGCSSTAIPVPPPTPLSQGSKTRRKGGAAPKSQIVPTNMTFVFRTRLHRGSSSSNVTASETLYPSTSTPSSGSSPAHRRSSSSPRDPRCTCSLRPDSNWVSHWRRSCPHNPGRLYPCPKGCGREFTRKDNAKRHVNQCRLLEDNEPPPER